MLDVPPKSSLLSEVAPGRCSESTLLRLLIRRSWVRVPTALTKQIKELPFFTEQKTRSRNHEGNIWGNR